MISLLGCINTHVLHNGQHIWEGCKLQSSQLLKYYWVVSGLNSKSFRATAYDKETNKMSSTYSGKGDVDSIWWSLYE